MSWGRKRLYHSSKLSTPARAVVVNLGRPFVLDEDRAELEQVIEELQTQAGLDAAGNGMRAHLAGKGHQRSKAEDTQQ